jgi:formylglycine-generating enzyme required for sulfatase activity
MVFVPADATSEGSRAFCIDKYEASRPDATADSAGVDNSRAVSRKGVLPWFVNPMTAERLAEFKAACKSADKRICASDEWFTACGGPSISTYVFGDVFSVETCNSVDTYCDDYCVENGIPEDTCNMSTNCGYDCGVSGDGIECFRAAPTGSFGGCTNDFGTFDINGNVWEIVPSSEDERGYEVRGGAFNCASPSVRLKCSYNATWTALFAGFRCCKDPGGDTRDERMNR